MAEDIEATWIKVRVWSVSAALPPEESTFPFSAAEEAIDYARRRAHERVNTTEVVDGNGFCYARFCGTWFYTPEGDASG